MPTDDIPQDTPQAQAQMEPSDKPAARVATITATDIATTHGPQRRVERAERHWRLASSLIVLLILVLSNLAIQANRRAFDIKSDGFWALRRVQQCESLGHIPDVLYTGSSRTVYSTDAHLVDGIVRQQEGRQILGCNVGQMGASIEQDYYTFKRMVEDGYTPRVVVENLWEDNLNVNAPLPADTFGPHTTVVERLADLSDLPALQQHYGSGSAGAGATADFIAHKLVPLYGDHVGVLRALCGSSRIGPCRENTDEFDEQTLNVYRHSDPWGWAPIRTWSLARVPANELNTQYLRLYPFHNELHNFEIGGHQADYLAKFVALAKAHNVKMALVVSPFHPVYYKFFDDPTVWPMIAGYWQSFADAHGVPLYDESHAPGYTAADFNDPSHLSAQGGEKFSTWMASHIVEPLLHEQA